VKFSCHGLGLEVKKRFSWLVGLVVKIFCLQKDRRKYSGIYPPILHHQVTLFSLLFSYSHPTFFFCFCFNWLGVVFEFDRSGQKKMKLTNRREHGGKAERPKNKFLRIVNLFSVKLCDLCGFSFF